MMCNYEIKPYYGSSLEVNKSLIGRVRNQYVCAINDLTLLPKVVLIVLDDNLVDNVKIKDFGVSDIYGRLTHWLASKLNKLTETHKDQMPGRATRMDAPMFIGMLPPTHKNFNNNILRVKMANSMKSGLATNPNHITLHMKKVWDPEDGTLYREGHFTKSGFKSYWLSIDSALEFWDCHLAPKLSKHHPSEKTAPNKNRENSFHYHQKYSHHSDYSHYSHHQRNDKFHWSDKGVQRRKLPTPPPFQPNRRY